MRQDGRLSQATERVETSRHDHAYAHEALLYEGDEGFVAATLPFVREGVEAGEAVLVAVPRRRTERLQAALGRDAARVTFADMEELGRNPGRIIPVWRDFVADGAAAGRGMRGIGEPVWDTRAPDELVECRRHEALLNLAFDADPPWTLLCPYDASALPDEVVEDARRTHPYVWEEGRRVPSDAYLDPHAIVGSLDDVLAPPPAHAERLDFGRDEVASVRAAVARHAEEAALPAGRAADLVLAASEAATNSVRHAGGRGRLAVWREGATVLCDVRDAGRMDDPLAGRRRPSLDALDGRGLWIVHQLCDLVEVRPLADGTVVRFRIGR